MPCEPDLRVGVEVRQVVVYVLSQELTDRHNIILDDGDREQHKVKPMHGAACIFPAIRLVENCDMDLLCNITIKILSRRHIPEGINL